ncbi:MAG: glycosyltransferase family 2 protein [Chloroflexota bacterium]
MDTDHLPSVSVIVPCYNEVRTIPLLLDSLFSQTYPREKMEVVIADGGSTDGTREEIARFTRAHPEFNLRVLDNPLRRIPAGLNRALGAARGEIIIRMDAHAVPQSDYVARCVQILEEGRGDNVGGVFEIRPGGEGWIARAIAAAASHPLGVGDARYRLGGRAQFVDTVPFGAYRRSLIEKVGLFDESLLTNEDYEFNVRVRKAGGRIWFDPSIRTVYFARASLTALALQYGRYGYWKAKMLLRYPKTIRWRQLAGLFVLSWMVFGVLAIWFAWARWLLLIEAIIYSVALFVSGAQMAWKKRDGFLIFGVPMAIATMHFAWGLAFLWSLLRVDEQTSV